jgi:hypothetical protein
MNRLDYLLKQYENILDWYKQSEEKAKFLVTINTLIIGFVNGLVFVGVDKLKSVRLLYTLPIWVMLALSGAAIIGSYIFVLRAMWPRHHTVDDLLRKSQRLWFFGDIAKMTREDYAAAVNEWSELSLEETMIAQNHILSTNVWAKHEALNWAIALTIMALIFQFGLGVAYGITAANTPQ